MSNGENRKLAVLIDADNTSHVIIEGLLAEIAKYGTANVKRIYGDWKRTHLDGWVKVLPKYAIQPIQQFAYTTGKNATDMAMVIDAMDLLYTGHFDGFCIVSSDSDFTPLASRIRETGLTVYGFGEDKTPEAFVAACDRFIFTKLLRPEDSETKPAKRLTAKQLKQLKQDTKLINLLRRAVEAASDDSDWAPLGAVGSTIAKQLPEFDSRNYGYAKLSGLIKATQLFDMEERPRGDGSHKDIFVRDARPDGEA
jgi:uncharacterized LabA/DUF88 family protein